MNRLASLGVVVTCGFGLLVGGISAARAASVVYSPPKADEVRNRILESINELNPTAEQRTQVTSMWMGIEESPAPDRLLELVVQSFAIVDPKVLKLISECNLPAAGLLAPDGEFLKQSNRSPFFRSNLNLYYGRCLVERRLFDEAWEVLKSIDAHQVVDPSSLFFFRAVAAQGMLELKPALEAIDELLSNTERVPVRYSATASLMQADLQGLQEKSLGEIARLMADSERRLDHVDRGCSGQRIRTVCCSERLRAERSRCDGHGASVRAAGRERGAGGNACGSVRR